MHVVVAWKYQPGLNRPAVNKALYMVNP